MPDPDARVVTEETLVVEARRGRGLLPLFTKPDGGLNLSRMLMALVVLVAVAGFALLAVYAGRSGRIFAVGICVALAANAVGAFAGFLFGLPRYTSPAPPASALNPRAPEPAAGAAPRPGRSYQPSSNLEQVSDWLTKLLLGAGLTQLGHLGPGFGGFVEGIAGALSRDGATPAPAARTLAGALVVLYLAIGFLFGYVVTTLWYRQCLEDSLRAEEEHRATGTAPGLD